MIDNYKFTDGMVYSKGVDVEALNIQDLVLLQLFYCVTWDGDLIHKQVARQLCDDGLVEKIDGWNLITGQGVSYLLNEDLVRTSRT